MTVGDQGTYIVSNCQPKDDFSAQRERDHKTCFNQARPLSITNNGTMTKWASCVRNGKHTPHAVFLLKNLNLNLVMRKW